MLLNEQGAAIDSTYTINISQQPDFVNIRYDFNVKEPGIYTLLCTKEGYEEQAKLIEVPDMKKVKGFKYFTVEQINLLKAARKLGEAVVTASKVLMVMKGDTIVYNADAFQLTEGSMLEALIEQLPGTKLEEGGRITVNGHFVSSLLVNGKDFFKGDPIVALENLPAYIVDKIKVYQREPDFAYFLERNKAEKEKDPWVIDVNLKRQYAQGWIANAEAVYGISKRFLGRLFGLRFTDHSRIAVYANLNNLNKEQQPGRNGEWSPAKALAGIHSLKTGGLEFHMDGKKTRIDFTTNLQARLPNT